MFNADKKLALVLLLGIVGLYATPARAQMPIRLLFLGISKDGRPQQQAEHAVQLRIEGLDISVIRPKINPVLPCEQAGCLAPALDGEDADVALTARILKNERACLATLWLIARGQKMPFEQDITCRTDVKDGQLVGDLADAAAALIGDYLHHKESESVSNKISFPQISDIRSNAAIGTKKRWNWKKKTMLSIFAVLCATAIGATIALPILDGKVYQENNGEGIPFSLVPFATASGVLVGATAASITLLSFK